MRTHQSRCAGLLHDLARVSEVLGYGCDVSHRPRRKPSLEQPRPRRGETRSGRILTKIDIFENCKELI